MFLAGRHLKVSLFFKACRIKYHSSAGVYGFFPRPADDNEYVPKVKFNDPIYQLAEAYRNHGYKIASLNPLGEGPTRRSIPVLDLLNYDFGISPEQRIPVNNVINIQQSELTLDAAVETLREIYCSSIGIEIQHLEENEKCWFACEFEGIQSEKELPQSKRLELATELIKSQVFDNFLATKFATVKRYGGEGAESMIAFFLEILQQSCKAGLNDVIIGIPHRGRLNLLTGLLNFPPIVMFKKMKGVAEFPADIDATGDVLSHLTSSTDFNHEDKSVHVTLLPNPSHLEAVSPVVVGYARGRLQTLKTGDYQNDPLIDLDYPVLPIQVHGDASFSGQGVVMETLEMSNVPHYSVGGSVHLIVNNQIGFTTPPERGRSSSHCSDLMKMIAAPVIHVNGDYPEDVSRAARLAFSYRQKYKKDVLINLLCFRRWGHNEMDDPTFTNPLMYKKIHARSSVPDKYVSQLVTEKIITDEDAKDITDKYYNELNEQLKNIENHKTELCGMQKAWKKDQNLKSSVSVWDTGVPIPLLKFLAKQSVQLPEKFDIHPTLAKNYVQERLKKVVKGKDIDWATAEALAMGSLLYQGHNVRISGQDVGRGTFSQRHAMLVDQTSGEIHIPFNNMTVEQNAFLEIANTILSEEGILGFEYGFNIENTDNLLIWEAQFGDFFNAAQVVFDTLISSGETKWLLPSNLVILLPHGYDGAGPEHSSCRLERFLQMCDSKENKIDSDDVNWHIANPTTPAQIFHLLRNQVISRLPKPLIIVGPKILLRHPEAVSSLQDMAPGKHFESVMSDSSVNPKNVESLIFCTGKHFYLLKKEREERNLKNCAIIRLEKLCPFPAESLHNVIKSYSNAKNFIWSQEEHQNMGAWSFVQARFQNILRCRLRYAGRKPSAVPAVGIAERHHEEIKSVIKDTFQ